MTIYQTPLCGHLQGHEDSTQEYYVFTSFYLIKKLVEFGENYLSLNNFGCFSSSHVLSLRRIDQRWVLIDVVHIFHIRISQKIYLNTFSIWPYGQYLDNIN